LIRLGLGSDGQRQKSISGHSAHVVIQRQSNRRPSWPIGGLSHTGHSNQISIS
jgi:hypothetical protein